MSSHSGVDVTVAIMSYNNSGFISETIESVLAQTGVCFELLVFDDCSTDDTLNVLNRYVGDPRYTFCENSTNLGMMGNYNRCVDSGSGKYVVVLGSDDVMYQGHLASLYSALELHPESSLAYVQCNWIDESGRLIRHAEHPGHYPHSYFGHRDELVDLLSHDSYITPSAVMLRRSALDVVRRPDGYVHDPQLQAGDWDLWIRMAQFFPDFIFLKQATIGYRIHSGQVSTSFYSSDRPLAEHTTILERNLENPMVRDRLCRAGSSIWALYERRFNGYTKTIQDNYRSRYEEVNKILLSFSEKIKFKYFFSVILTTYNRPELLPDALKSLSVQQYKDFEVILVNDCGSPVEHLLDHCSFPVTYIRQGTNQGISAARNSGLKLAQGRYVAYLDDDDVYLPEHLKVLADEFRAHPDCLVYTDVVYIQEKLEDGARVEIGRSFPTAHDEFDRDKLFVHNYIPVNTFSHSLQIFKDIGLFDKGLTVFEDWDMLLRLVERLPVRRVRKVTTEVRSRVSGGNDHLLSRERGRFNEFYKKIYARYPEPGNERIRSEREAVLAGVMPKASWGVQDWLSDRKPSSSRVFAIKTMLAANPDVGTLGVVVVVPDNASPEMLSCTLESLGVQHRPVDKVFFVGNQLPPEAGGTDIELLQSPDPWAAVLSERIRHGDLPDFVWILFAGDRLLPHATLTMGEYRLRKPDPLVWYADEASLVETTPERPMLKPDFNVDLLRSYPYIGRNLVLSTEAIRAVGGLDDRLDDLCLIDFVWRLVEQVGPPVVGHIPEVLSFTQQPLMNWVRDVSTMTWFPVATQAHLERMGIDALVKPGPDLGLFRVEYKLSAHPLVSIIIPTRDHLAVLQACVEGLMAHTAYTNYELLIIDNQTVDQSSLAFLAGLENLSSDRVRVLRWPGAFDFAEMNNYAVSQARGEVLLFLNNDIQFSDRTRSDWVERLLTHAMRPEVGAVGSRLDQPGGQVDQCGQVLGMDNSVGLAFHGQPSDSQGYMSRMVVQQNVSALSASCLMMRKAVFDELGGFDSASFPVYYADTDLCVKATQAGYLLVLEPDTGLLHMGGATRLLTEKFGLRAKPDDQQHDKLYQRWLPQLANDPYYHPAFSKYSPGFSLSQDASRINEPLPGRPLPVVLAAHADFQGCGHYRIMQPFNALSKELRLEGGVKLNDFHFTDVARIQPDVIVLQGAWIHEGILTQIRRYREITGAKVILEFDDYAPNIPTRSVYRKTFRQGAIKHMRRAIELVDWIVVSTPTLAQEYSGFHSDIRVALNGLSTSWWSGLKSQRRTGRKLRVGWAGGSSHTGDLAEIRYVIKDLADEVEWVFMGMKPEGVECEFHRGVSIEKYPSKLASLNLDLAVVPLEINQFNRCKSNLRLLELGVCGVPIICTDIDPFRCDLPVTLVPNKHMSWIEAIRSHVAEPEALAGAGDLLREIILRDWMLEGSFLEQWVRAWGCESIAHS